MDGKRQGQGKVTYANGDIYEGTFEADQRQGDRHLYRY